MDMTQLSFLAGLSFTEFAHLVTIYREEEHKKDGDAPSYNVCVQRLCAEASDRLCAEASDRAEASEASDRPTFEAARSTFET
jgi:hypothetical protein